MPMARRFILLVIFVGIAAWGASGDVRADPLEHWRSHDPASTQTIDHRCWSGFLFRYRSNDSHGIARVAYRHVTAEDRAAASTNSASVLSAATPPQR